MAHAGFGVSPDILRIPVHRGEYTGWVDLTHIGGAKPVAIELVMYERILDLDGNTKDTLVPNKDFVIYPAQILLRPGQVVRSQVVYRNKEKIEFDRAYFLLAKQVSLPDINAQEKESEITVGLSVRINYNVAVLMETGKPGFLTFVSSKALDSGKVELIMENKSKGIFTLSDANILAGGKKITDFTGKRSSVLPGQKRRFVFEYPRPLKAEEVRFVK
jgi:P pilus assembly chaperone PapD